MHRRRAFAFPAYRRADGDSLLCVATTSDAAREAHLTPDAQQSSRPFWVAPPSPVRPAMCREVHHRPPWARSLPRLGRRLCAGGSFLLIAAMTEHDFETYRDAVIQADQERCRQAYELAMAELGPTPCQHTKPAEFIDHLDRVTQLAREKLARLI